MNSVLIEVMLENFVHTIEFYGVLYNDDLLDEGSSDQMMRILGGGEECRELLKQFVQELK